MSAIPSQSARPLSVPPLFRWMAVAWSRLGWKHVALCAVIFVIYPFIGANGGILFLPANVTFPFVDGLLSGAFLAQWLPTIFAVMVADAALEDGVAAWRTFGLAWIVSAIGGPEVHYWYAKFALGRVHDASFWTLAQLLHGGLIIWIYASWRKSQQATRRVREVETQRVRARQQLIASRLMALQARVDPEFLFDALTTVVRTHPRDADGADRMLGDLIAFLRALLPGRSLSVSSIKREALLVDTWMRVRRNVSPDAPEVVQLVPTSVAQEAIAPMVLLPFVQLINPSHSSVRSWSLEYAVSGHRLHVLLSSTSEPISLVASSRMDSLRQRLAELYGDEARLTIHPRSGQPALDLPRVSPVRFG